MKIVKILAAASIAALVVACSDVPPGHVGIRVNKLGSSKGVQAEELQTGRYYVGWNEQLFVFPTYRQNTCWTMGNDPLCGSPNDESIRFQAKGVDVNVDVGVDYMIDPSRVSHLFQTFRMGVSEITDRHLRSKVRDAFVEFGASMPVDAVYDSGKVELMKKVEDRVRAEVAKDGIILLNLTYLSSIRVPDNIREGINKKFEANQRAEQRENEIREATAAANKKIEDARGDAESTRLRAEAEAKNLEVVGAALKRNPEIIRLREIDKWNGALPTTMLPNSAIPIVGK